MGILLFAHARKTISHQRFVESRPFDSFEIPSERFEERILGIVRPRYGFFRRTVAFGKAFYIQSFIFVVHPSEMEKYF